MKLSEPKDTTIYSLYDLSGKVAEVLDKKRAEDWRQWGLDHPWHGKRSRWFKSEKILVRYEIPDVEESA